MIADRINRGRPMIQAAANRMTRIIPMIPETRMIRKIPETVVISPAMTIKRVVPNSLKEENERLMSENKMLKQKICELMTLMNPDWEPGSDLRIE